MSDSEKRQATFHRANEERVNTAYVRRWLEVTSPLTLVARAKVSELCDEVDRLTATLDRVRLWAEGSVALGGPQADAGRSLLTLLGSAPADPWADRDEQRSTWEPLP